MLVPLSTTLAIVDTATDKVIADLPGLERASLAAAHDSPLVYATADNLIEIINSETGATVGSFALDPFLGSIAISPDNRTLFVTALAEDKLFIVDVATHTLVGTIPVASPSGLVAVPGTAKLYVANSASDSGLVVVGRTGAIPNNVISVIDLYARRVIHTLPVEGPLSIVTITPDGKKLYLYNRRTGIVTVIGTANDEVLATISTGAPP